MGVYCVHYIDDFLVAGATAAEARSKLYILRDMALRWGWKWNASKEEVGQIITFLGILINTVKMVVAFDKEACASFVGELEEALADLHAATPIEPATIARIAGKLSRYSCVLQAGRNHARPWYIYSKWQEAIYPEVRAKLIAETTQYWLPLLRRWASGELDGTELPIMSISALLATPGAFHVVVSDASGPHGHGHYFGSFNDPNPAFYSRMWDDDEPFASSILGELRSLLDYMKRTPERKKLVLWMTDCLGAAYAVNRGSSATPDVHDLLAKILELADDKHISLISAWFPRDENVFADYLSHLSVVCVGSPQQGYVDHVPNCPY